jgi:hypothetical protein
VVLITPHPFHFELRRELPARVIEERVDLDRAVAVGQLEAGFDAVGVDRGRGLVLGAFFEHPDPALVVFLHFVVE